MSYVIIWANGIVDWTDPNMFHCSIMLWFGSTNEPSSAYAACFSEVLQGFQIGFVVVSISDPLGSGHLCCRIILTIGGLCLMLLVEF